MSGGPTGGGRSGASPWTLFYRNRHLLALTVAVVLVAGVSAFLALPRLEDPRITTRNAIVVTPFPGASAERTEALLTDRIEERLREIPEIETLESTSRAGVSVVSIELRDEVTEADNAEVFSEIRDKLGEVPLPPGALEPRFDDRRGPVAFTVVAGAAWTGDGPPRVGILGRYAAELADRLRNVPGTELVRLYGEPEEEVTVAVDPEALATLGLHPATVSRAVAAADAKGPAGTLHSSRADLLLEVGGEVDGLERLRRIPLLPDAEGSVLLLGDVATVTRGWREPPEELALSDGRRTVLVAARAEGDVQVDRWATEAVRVVDGMTASVGEGVAVEVLFDQSTYTEERLGSLATNLLLGAGVVVAAVVLMMGWRLALIVGTALPLVAATVLFAILVSGGALHQMSIFGMIIALGLLIDNAIVVVDEVRKRREAGAGAEAALDGALRHLAVPLLASTVTTVLAFLPIVLLPGNTGDFVGWIGGSVILAVAASYLLSMTVIGALAARLDGFTEAGDRAGDGWWRHGLPGGGAARLYRRWMERGLRRPVLALLVACLPAFAGFAIAPLLGSQFFPPVDRDMFDVRIWLPRSTTLAETRQQVEAAEAILRRAPEVRHVHWLAGGSFPSVYYNLVMDRDDSPHFAQGVVTASSSEAVGGLIPHLQERLDEGMPGAQVLVRQFGQGPPTSADVQYRLYGPSMERLRALGDGLRLHLQQHPDVLHTRVTLPRGEPKLWVDVGEDRARLAGLTLREVAGQLQAGLDGSTGGSFLEGREEMPVRVRYPDSRRGDPAHIASLPLVGPRAGDLPLDALGELRLVPAAAGISRHGGERVNVVEGYTRNEALPIDVTHESLEQARAAGFELPPGYRLELGGEVEQDQQARGNLMLYVPLLATLMVATLILAFSSVRLAAVLGAVAFLSVGLGLLATFAIDFPVSFNTILGTLGLIGVALNDTIVVLAAIREDPDARRGAPAAVLRQVQGTTRHVLATTLTTIGGFLPLLLFVGGDFWPSLAIVLAGGIPGATLLALVFVPAAYVLLHRGDDPAPEGTSAPTPEGVTP